MGNKSKKNYKVLFKGIILPGFDKEQVVDNVHSITRIPKATIKRKFFSGKTVVIRHADSQEDASRLQDTFAEAGIETYTEKLPETRSPFFSAKKKWLIVTAAISIITMITFILFNTPDTVNDTDTTLVDNKTLNSKKIDLKKINKEQLSKGQDKKDLLINDQPFNVLIKMTDVTELNRLRSFLPLFDLDSEYFDALNIRDFKHKIATENPLYLFKTSQENGLLFSIDKLSEKSVIKKIQEQLNTINNKLNSQHCSRTSPIYLYHNQQTILLSSRKYKNNEDIQFNKLSIKLNSFEWALKQSEESADMPFNFYYQINNKQSKQSHNKALILTAKDNTFRLQQSKSLTPANVSLLEHLGIKDAITQQLSSLPIKNLSELMLLIISKEEHRYSQNNKPVTPFIKQMIAPVQAKSNTGKILPYQQELDIELHPHWQSGPFAITTDNYHFDQHLVIEILAKGQNIKNLMEYSHSAELTTHAVYNTNKENIIYNDCAYHPSLENSFKNLDGEQEAYINDEFVTYHAATAKKAVKIQPGYQLKDVEEISGQIILNQPETIMNKEITSPSTVQFNQFKHFSILTSMLDKQTINYLAVGDQDYFLTIRAYNQMGDPLETIELKETALLNNSVSHYEQSFNEPVASIKIFFTNAVKNTKYSFSFKPEIMVVQSPLNPVDNNPVPFDSSNTDLILPGGEIKTDNPQWLGQKISEKVLVPFYISLFLHEANISDISSQKKDAVLNIKTGITALISQNISSVKLDLSQKQQSLFNNFITFAEKEIFTDDDNSKNKNIQMNQPEMYLDSNSAFEFSWSTDGEINGSIHLSLPTSFNHHTSKYLSPGQVIKLGNILVKPIKISRQKIQFQIIGKINDLVQLKLYNANKELISEPLEFKQIENNKALLTLLYYDKIDSIKLILAQESIRKEYPFIFSTSASN